MTLPSDSLTFDEMQVIKSPLFSTVSYYIPFSPPLSVSEFHVAYFSSYLIFKYSLIFFRQSSSSTFHASVIVTYNLIINFLDNVLVQNG